ncbi:thermonuclease family protein [Methyloceanibacter sp.]|uniref:thermonuclease family protein n=1 Tax=Methyloceanibacter sp. TaxID=1965321 RepID=UPI003D6CDDFC
MVNFQPVALGSLLAATCLTFALPSASALACELSEPQKGTVAEVKDGETLQLTDGTVVRLVNAKAPTAPIAAQADRPWPMVNEAKEALSKLASGAEVELRYGGARTDRHDHALAQVYVVKGEERIWLQGELVGNGFARVYSFPDNHACVSELLAREAGARAKGEGIWGSWAYRVLAADNVERLGRLTRSYQLVEGVVAQVGDSGGRIYLNFDKDWHKDFTVLIERKDGEAFKAAGIDPKALAGKKLRVRGWIEWRNGPMIHVTHVEQIELLPEGGGSPPPAPEAPKGPPTGAIAL